MKCPKCSFHTSARKDICPRCEFDLRARKVELGMPVLSPGVALEHLIAEHRRTKPASALLPAVTTAPSPTVSAPEKKPSIWSKWLPVKKKNSPPPAPAYTHTNAAPVPQTNTTEPSTVTTPPGPAANFNPVAQSKSAPSGVKLYSSNKFPPPPIPPTAATPPTPQLESDESGLEFSIGPVSVSSAPPPQDIDGQLLAVPSFAPTPTPVLVNPPAPLLDSPAAINDADLRELISALEELSPVQDSDSSEALFDVPVTSIDANLDEIIQALDNVQPEEELDNFALFNNELADLAGSLETHIQEAKDSTVSLQTKEFEAIPPVPEILTVPTVEPPVGESNEDERLFEQLLDAMPSQKDLDTESVSAVIEPAMADDNPPPPETLLVPTVQPSVMEFNDDEQLFEQQLDEMLGENDLDIESVTAVKAPEKKVPPQAPGTFMLDDVEISVEIEEESTSETPHTEGNAEDLQDLLSTYAALEQGLEQRTITDESNGPATAAEPTLEHFETASERDRQVVSTLREAQSTLSKLQSLDDALFNEVSALLAKSLGVEQTEIARTSVAVKKPLPPVDELQKLSEELGSELEALQAEGSTLYTLGEAAFVDEPSASESADEPLTGCGDELSALESELSAEISALESEGLHFHSENDQTSPEIIEAADVELKQLESELSEELSAFEQEGATFHAAEQPGTVPEPTEISPDALTELSSLEAELSTEIAQLENEGLTFHTETSEPETAWAEPAENSELSSLEAELSTAIAQLEDEGLTFHAEPAAGEPVESAQVASISDEEQAVEMVAEPAAIPHSSEESSAVIDETSIETEELAVSEPLTVASEIVELAEEGVTFHAEADVVEPENEPLVEPTDKVITEAVCAEPEGLPPPLDAQLTTEIVIESAPESIPAEENNEEIVDLAQIADLFDPTPKKVEKKNSTSARSIAELAAEEAVPLETAVSTGVFLAADLARIIDGSPAAEPTAAIPIIEAQSWEAALDEIAAQSAITTEIEFADSELSAMRQSATTSVLFDLIEEELVDPGKKRISELPTSASVRVENTKLKTALDVFEHEEKRVSKLRKLAKERGGLAVGPKKSASIQPAAAWRRIAAMVVDAVVLLGLGMVFGYVSFIPPELLKMIVKLEVRDIDTLVPVAVTFVQLIFGLWIVLSTLMVSGRGQTLGGQLLGLEVVDDWARVPNFTQALLRALSQVSTLLTFGIGLLPLLFGKKRTLHDQMAGTYVRTKAS